MPGLGRRGFGLSGCSLQVTCGDVKCVATAWPFPDSQTCEPRVGARLARGAVPPARGKAARSRPGSTLGPRTLEKVVLRVHVGVVGDDVEGGAPGHHLEHEDAQRPPVHAEPWGEPSLVCLTGSANTHGDASTLATASTEGARVLLGGSPPPTVLGLLPSELQDCLQVQLSPSAHTVVPWWPPGPSALLGHP